MDDFNSETDSDYTSYWRDWVSSKHFHMLCAPRDDDLGDKIVQDPTEQRKDVARSEQIHLHLPSDIYKPLASADSKIPSWVQLLVGLPTSTTTS
jgi:hypothetical protein